MSYSTNEMRYVDFDAYLANALARVSFLANSARMFASAVVRTAYMAQVLRKRAAGKQKAALASR